MVSDSKREHLLNEIRTQAAEIQRLMSQLQLVNQQASAAVTQNPSSPHRSSFKSDSPTRSPSKVGIASLPPEKSTVAGQDVVIPEVLDWVAKAKESIEAFGEYIGIGTASVPKNLIGGSDDSMDSDSDDDSRFLSARASEDEGEGASVVSEDRELAFRHVSPETRGRRRDVLLSSEKPATVPSHDAPFGLMANLLRKTKQEDDQGREDAEKQFGVARRDYFRPGLSSLIPRVFPGLILDSLSCSHPGSYSAHHRCRPRRLPRHFDRGYCHSRRSRKAFQDVSVPNLCPRRRFNSPFSYFDYMNPSLSIVDPVLYTAGNTYYRSPLLFTVSKS